jgi:hypothetical protein
LAYYIRQSNTNNEDQESKIASPAAKYNAPRRDSLSYSSSSSPSVQMEHIDASSPKHTEVNFEFVIVVLFCKGTLVFFFQLRKRVKKKSILSLILALNPIKRTPLISLPQF